MWFTLVYRSVRSYNPAKFGYMTSLHNKPPRLNLRHGVGVLELCNIIRAYVITRERFPFSHQNLAFLDAASATTTICNFLILKYIKEIHFKFNIFKFYRFLLGR